VGARSLLRLALSLDGSTLNLRGDLLDISENFWSGKAQARGSSAATLALQVPADDVAKLLATELPSRSPSLPGRLELKPWARVEGPVAAMEIMDADGDGRLEVLVLTDHALLALSPEGKVVATHLLTGGRATSPPRVAFGALALNPYPRGVVVRSAQRDRPETLVLDARAGRWASAGIGPPDSVLVQAGERVLKTALVPGQTAFVPVVEGGQNSERWSLSAPFIANASVGRAGAWRTLFVLTSGSLEAVGSGSKPDPALRVGAGVAFADLDGDGQPELVVSAPDPEPIPERVRVLAWPQGAALAQWEASGPVRHMAAGDLDGDGADEAIVALSLPDGSSSLERLHRISR
jgi:hypothetical protein